MKRLLLMLLPVSVRQFVNGAPIVPRATEDSSSPWQPTNPFAKTENYLTGLKLDDSCDAADGSEKTKEEKCACCIEAGETWIWDHVEKGLKEWCSEHWADMATPREEPIMKGIADASADEPMTGEATDEAARDEAAAAAWRLSQVNPFENPLLARTMREEGCHGHGECIKHMICKFYRKMPRVAVGFFFAKAHPMEVSRAYCFGKGYCEGYHEQTKQDEVTVMDPEKLSSVLTGLQSSISPRALLEMEEEHTEESRGEEEHTEENMGAKQSVDTAANFLGTAKLLQEFDSSPSGMHHHHHHNHGHVCKECYVKVFKAVMWMAVKKTKHACEHTDCPVLKKWCKFAAWHKPEAFGMLMAWVEPWKFAIGRCWHEGKEGEGKGASWNHGGNHPWWSPHHWWSHGETTADVSTADVKDSPVSRADVPSVEIVEAAEIYV